MGDLNMTPPTPSRWTGMRPLGEAPTFPADEPGHQLDHILTDDPTLCGLRHARRRGCRSRIIGRLSSTFLEPDRIAAVCDLETTPDR